MKKEISEAIRSVGNIEYETVLEMRYLSFMSWDEKDLPFFYCRRNSCRTNPSVRVRILDVLL